MNKDYTANTLVTHGVRVTARSAFVPDQSSHLTQTFVFAYRVIIANEGDESVQLLRRHWDIVDGFGEHRAVEGEGVVGRQPLLRPGEAHTYVSGCMFHTPVGRMTGFYEMIALPDGRNLRVEIPSFLLQAPYLFN